MTQFVGTIFVSVRPMKLGPYNIYRGWELPCDENGEDDGYIVIYPGGRETWHPKKDFDNVFKSVTSVELNFSTALDLVKDGVALGLARKNWNGDGMFVVYQPGYPEGVITNDNTQKAFGLPEGSVIKIQPHLQLICSDGSVAEWSPSASDVINEDWMLVFNEEQYMEVLR